MKRFKKIYIEITNSCNLNCKFCIKNKRRVEFISIKNFKILIDKLKPYTDYLYFHVMGEPLMHPNINELINLAYKDYNINITTNGYLIKKISSNKNIRQLNISLHSFDESYNIDLIDYLNNIFNTIDNMNNTYISLRLWVKNKFNNKVIDYINNRYNLNINYDVINYKINDHIFINNFQKFIWPDINNNYYSKVGKCKGLIDHIGILVNGNIIPCCLDSEGILTLGNIYEDSFDEILKKDRVIKMINGFQNNKKTEELCRHCSFIGGKND